MMSVNAAISSAFFANGAVPNGAGGDNPQIKALEQKLQRLNKEKKEADQNHDAEKVKELEKEIQAAQQKLERLKQNQQQKNKLEEEEAQKKQKLEEAQKENKEHGQRKDDEKENELSPDYGAMTDNALLGIYLNRLA